MDEPIEELTGNEHDNFDVSQAKKLLENIRYLADMGKFPVSDPRKLDFSKIDLRQWIKWFKEMVEYNGELGFERDWLQMVMDIDERLIMIKGRVEEGFRNLLMVLERKDITIKNLQKKVKMLEAETVELSDDDTESDDEEDVESEDKEEETDKKPEVKPTFDLGMSPTKKPEKK